MKRKRKPRIDPFTGRRPRSAPPVTPRYIEKKCVVCAVGFMAQNDLWNPKKYTRNLGRKVACSRKCQGIQNLKSKWRKPQ